MGASDEVIANSEMNKVQRYVDAVNLMNYDYYEPGSESITGNHAPHKLSRSNSAPSHCIG